MNYFLFYFKSQLFILRKPHLCPFICHTLFLTINQQSERTKNKQSNYKKYFTILGFEYADFEYHGN